VEHYTEALPKVKYKKALSVCLLIYWALCD